MKITYDPYADAIYLTYSDKAVSDTAAYQKDLIVDFDKNKTPVGMEILSISKKVPQKELGSLQFELTTEKPKSLLS